MIWGYTSIKKETLLIWLIVLQFLITLTIIPVIFPPKPFSFPQAFVEAWEEMQAEGLEANAVRGTQGWLQGQCGRNLENQQKSMQVLCLYAYCCISLS